VRVLKLELDNGISKEQFDHAGLLPCTLWPFLYWQRGLLGWFCCCHLSKRLPEADADPQLAQPGHWQCSPVKLSLTLAPMLADGKGGQLASSMVVDQVAVLNKAYSEAGFTFTLSGISRHTNASWCVEIANDFALC